MKTRNIPNLVTSLRIILVPPFLLVLLKEHYSIAFLLFVIAGVSDALDGFLAKHYGWTSELGGILDPIADKLLLVGAILVLGWLRDLPIWLVALAILRDLIIVTGAIGYHLIIERVQASPLFISKINTLVQLLLVCIAIVSHGLISLPPWLLKTQVYITALTTVWSGAAYVWQWSHQAWNTAHNNSDSEN